MLILATYFPKVEFILYGGKVQSNHIGSFTYIIIADPLKYVFKDAFLVVEFVNKVWALYRRIRDE